MSVEFYDLHPKTADLRADVLAGLSRPQKRIRPKFFYDQRGSRLFDAITELPEYYPARTEIEILQRHGTEMADLIGRDVLLIELGSGSSLKIRVLLQALRPAVYMPVDISREHLLESSRELARGFPGLEVHAVCADYTGPFDLPLDTAGRERAVFFPGSSIGNFDPAEAEAFLARVGTLAGPGGKLLIGVDLIKDIAILNAAYNDARGVTAQFNLNLLRRINRELDGNFDLDAFHHRAFFNEAAGRIEMHLVSTTDQWAQVAGEDFSIRSGESIHTENSYKYSIAGFRGLARSGGFESEGVWTDADSLFSVHCLRFDGTD